MPNDDHLKILRQGREAWNQWRREHPEIQPELDGAQLIGADLRKTDLRGIDLRDADLSASDLSDADIGHIYVASELRTSELGGADLRGANLSRANLMMAGLILADLRDATLAGADLRLADLRRAELDSADLTTAMLKLARVGGTVFSNLDLSQTKGLEELSHLGPSRISVDTLTRSAGTVPESFLRGCGLSDWEIETAKLYAPNLGEDEITSILYEIDRIRGESPIRVNPLFISYSHADTAFVNALEAQLDRKRVRYWRDVHDLKAGKIETQIERGIRLNPTFLLVLSKNSVSSDWVEWEAGRARELEKELKRDVLCPIALDDAWKTAEWSGALRQQIQKYYIVDFSHWRNADGFANSFDKLIDGLGLFYPER